MNKIFQIGMNKCGTLSLHELFNRYTILKSIHWDYGKIAYNIQNNYRDNKWLLNGYDHIDVFTDMECCILKDNKYEFIYGYKYFDILDKQYPHSLFILNTRNIDNWINSRLKHMSGYVLEDKSPKIITKLNPPINYYKMYNISNIEQIIEEWKKDWVDQHTKVLGYFNKRKNDLLVYDIEKDPFSKIVDFFKPYGISFNTDIMPHDNKTKVES